VWTPIEDVDRETLDKWQGYDRAYKPSRKRLDPNTQCHAFDFETRKGPIPDDIMKTPSGFLYKQTPYMMQWGDCRAVDHEFDVDDPYCVVNGKFLTFLTQQLHRVDVAKRTKGDRKSKREVMMWSFNGAVFDNHLLLETSGLARQVEPIPRR